ncbi:hypothetical protein D9M68_689590 [compost metagenome]
MPRHHVIDRRRHPLVRHVLDLHAGGAVQHFAGDVHRRPGTRAAVGERLARPGRRDHLRHGLDARGRVGHQQHRLHRGLDHRREAVQRVVAGGRRQFEHHRRERERVRRVEQRVAIGRRPADKAGTDHPAGARAVLDDHRLLQAGGQLVGIQPRHGVGIAAGRIGHDHGHGLGRIGRGHRAARGKGERSHGSGGKEKAAGAIMSHQQLLWGRVRGVGVGCCAHREDKVGSGITTLRLFY